MPATFSHAVNLQNTSSPWLAAWLAGITPLAPGQKAPFLAVYTTFFVINNFLRPVRLAVATYTASYFEDAIKFLQRRLNLNRVFATGLVVFLFNVCGTFAAMFVGVNLAALASGVPPQLGLLFGAGGA